MSKFKVGDKVRTANLNTSGTGLNNSTPDGVEFEVRRVVESGTSFYYTGDPNDFGIWEKRLELVEPAPKFKVGDRVRFADSLGGRTTGQIGTIKEPTSSQYDWRVWIGDDRTEYGWIAVHEHEIELLESFGPTLPEFDSITKPQHYNAHPSGIEVIDITKHETFLRGNIIKYVMRAPYKGNELSDLRKARQYLDWEIARVEASDG